MTINRDSLIAATEAQLASATTAADSVNLLYNIYDLTPLSDRATAVERLYATVHHTGDVRRILEVSRRVTAVYTYVDTLRLRHVLRDVSVLPQNDEQQATESYVYMSLVATQAVKVSERERQARIVDLIGRLRSADNKNVYEQTELLFSLCNFLDINIPGELLVKYFNRFDEYMSRLPYHLNEMERLRYEQAATIYSSSGDAAKAIAADRKLLSVLDALTRSGRNKGGRFCNYDYEHYQCYRRMLSNYEALAEADIKTYYQRITQLAEQNDDVRHEEQQQGLATIYYLMATKQYSQALTLIKEKVGEGANSAFIRQLYKMMLEAATAVDSREDMLTAAIAYNALLEKYIAQKSADLTRELQVVYDYNSLQDANSGLEILQRENELRWHRIVFAVASVAILLLVAILLIVLWAYRRMKQLSKRLTEANALLTSERDNLNQTQRELIEARDQARKADSYKTQFIADMSHEVRTPLDAIVEYSHLIVDNLGDNKRRYLERYAQIVDVSADMLRMLVNDVLSLSEYDRGQVALQCSAVAVHTLCEVAINSVSRYLTGEVALRFASKEEEDVTINTDAQRVEQVLINLLKNGIKFTEEGYVELSYTINRNDATVTFAVTDTGIGVPEGKETIIFERFTKLSKLTQGTGLGLNICKTVAELLHGNVCVDTSYTAAGSRFLFTIPM